MTGRLAEAIIDLRYRQITALLDHGVNINGRLDDGRTPIMVSLDIRDPDKRRHMFRFLAHHDADILESDSREDVSVFQHCCRHGFIDLMEIILHKAGVSAVNLLGRDKLGRTALYHAVMSEDPEVVHTVLDNINLRQQSVDVPDYDGFTPLLYARKHGLMEIADALIERGNANPRICDGQRHMNAFEWEAEAEQQQRRQNAKAKKHAKERYMIFPPIDHATRRKERLAKVGSKTASLPNLNQETVATTNRPSTPPNSTPTSLPIPIPSKLPDIHSPMNGHSVSNNAKTQKQNFDPRTKSVDSAITLLGLASQNAEQKSYAMSFVSSRSGKQNPYHRSNHTTNDRHLRRTWMNMMDAYSVQNTGNFRKPAKPPSPLPEIQQDLDRTGKNKSKMSTLAIILRAGRGGKNQRGKHQGKELSGDSPGKLSRRRTTANQHGDGKAKVALPGVTEDESEWRASKKGKKSETRSSRKQDVPNIIVS